MLIKAAIASVLQEANTAFDLNTALFTTIKTTSEETAKVESKEIPIIIEQTPQEKSYPLSQVAAVIAAGMLKLLP